MSASKTLTAVVAPPWDDTPAPGKIRLTSADKTYRDVRALVREFYRRTAMLPGSLPVTFAVWEQLLAWHVEHGREVRMRGMSMVLHETLLYLVPEMPPLTLEADASAVPVGRGL